MKKWIVLSLLFCMGCQNAEFGSTGAVNTLFGVAGQGGVETIRRTVGEFKEIWVSNGVDLELNAMKEPGQNTLVLAFNQNLIPIIFQEQIKDVLILRTTTRQNIASATEKTISITSPPLEKIRVSDRSRVTFEKFNSKHLEIECNGEAEIVLSGELQSLTIKAFDSCQIEASELKTQSADIELTDNASLKVSVEKSLNTVLEGESLLEYTGEPEIKKTVSANSQLTQTAKK